MVSLFLGMLVQKKSENNTCSFEIVTFLKFKIGRMHLLEIFLDILSFYHLLFFKKKMTHHLKCQYSISEEETEELRGAIIIIYFFK